MKKGLLYATLLVITLTGIYSVTRNFNGKKITEKKTLSSSEDADGALKWDQERLSDPATGRIPDNIRKLELAYAATLPSDATIKNFHGATINWNMRGP